jgi:hypothetical protein
LTFLSLQASQAWFVRRVGGSEKDVFISICIPTRSGRKERQNACLHVQSKTPVLRRRDRRAVPSLRFDLGPASSTLFMNHLTISTLFDHSSSLTSEIRNCRVPECLAELIALCLGLINKSVCLVMDAKSMRTARIPWTDILVSCQWPMQPSISSM